MKRAVFLTILAASAFIAAGAASAGDFGLGATVGEPTGISAKTWFNDRSAMDFAFAWSLDDNESFNIHADYLIHDYRVFNVTRGKLPLYYGIGGRLLNTSDTRVGIRGVIGLDYLFASSPLDLFFEIAPVLDFAPDTQMDLEGGVGMRFYFR